MVALINVSDLAAMGAKPIGLLVSTVMPETMPVNDYERFLDGLAQASREWSCPVVGGNIKDGPDFTATGTALGSVGKDRAMRRIGARPGDRLLVVGEMGIFWAAVLRRLLPSVQFDARDDALCDEALFRPVARIREGMMLAQTRHASACMDSSDGVIGCLHELAHVNGMDILIRSDAIRPRQCIQQVADQARIDARKLMLSWGGWELVCTAAPAGVRVIQDAMKSLGTPCREIGEVRLGDGSVWIHDEGGVRRLTNFASVRFAGTSFFTHGLESYIDFLRNCPLTLS
jgi:thiamine-monophosphate kinase